MLTIIVPTYNEAANVDALHAQRLQFSQTQWIIVDGGSSDGTLTTLKQFSDWTVLTQTPGGRAKQMNLGAQYAQGEVLLFLHADTQLPVKVTELINHVLQDQSVVAGAFHIRYQSERIAHWLCHWLAFRSRHTRLPYGDQAIFVRKNIFEQMGGYPDQPLMEDYEFSRRLWRYGKLVVVPDPVVTSARRFEAGILKTGLLMKAIWGLYNLGFSAERLAGWYKAVR